MEAFDRGNGGRSGSYQPHTHLPREYQNPGSWPWLSFSELAMVRSFFYPDRSPLDPAPERQVAPYRDSSGKFINTFTPPTFAQRDRAFRKSRLPTSPELAAESAGFSYFTKPTITKTAKERSAPKEYIPKIPLDCRIRAINIVNRIMFKYSLDNPLPHAVLTTAQLTAALLYEDRMEPKWKCGNYDLVDNLAVESTLASALGKFVTGFVDRDVKLDASRKDGKSTKSTSRLKRRRNESEGSSRAELDSSSRVSNSMLSNAAQIGLPAAFVELRHKITHDSTTPPLWEMKLMAFRALDWLWDNYWLKLDVGKDVWGLEEREVVRQEEAKAKAYLSPTNEQPHLDGEVASLDAMDEG